MRDSLYRPAPPVSIHPIVVAAFCLCLASFPFEFPERTFRYEVPTMTTSLFLFVTLFQPRACYFNYIPSSIWWLAAFLYTDALALALNGWRSFPDMAQDVLLLIQALLFFWACSNVLRHDHVARAALWSFVIACIVRALLPFVGVGRTGEAVWTGGERITAFGQNANWSAKLLSMGVLILVGLMYVHPRAPKRLRWLALAGIAGMGVAIVDTGSRGGILALAIGLLAFAFGPSSGRSRWAVVRNGLIGVASIAFLAVAAMRTEVMRNRFEDTASTGNMAGREVLFPTLWQMFLERPWTGWGSVNNQFELADRIAEQDRLKRDSHNLVLEVLTTTGIVGAVPFFMALALIVRAAWRARHGLHGITPIALLVLAGAGAMSGNPITNKLFWLTMAYAVAAAVPLVRQARAPLRSTSTLPLPLASA
jgi:O-antigen ligase